MDKNGNSEAVKLQSQSWERDRVPANFDDLLTVLGEFGRYQKWVYFLCSLPLVLTAMQILGWVFIGAANQVQCWDSINTTDPTGLRNVSEMSHCNLMLECNSGFVYDTATIKDSVTIEFDLVRNFLPVGLFLGQHQPRWVGDLNLN